MTLVTFIHIEDPYELDAADLPSMFHDETSFDLEQIHQPEEPHSQHVSPDEALFSPQDSGDDDSLSTLSERGDPAQENILVLHLLRKFREGPGYWYVIQTTPNIVSCWQMKKADKDPQDGRL